MCIGIADPSSPFAFLYMTPTAANVGLDLLRDEFEIGSRQRRRDVHIQRARCGILEPLCEFLEALRQLLRFENDHASATPC